MNDDFKIYYRCEMLIDQNRYIGSDPVGHCCMNKADYERLDGYLICESCKNMIFNEPNRITYPIGSYGKEFQDKIFNSFFKNDKEDE